jgi:O-antigen/teichoic acid export membrane protein
MSNIENSKRIAINTVLLYFRMFISMGVALYTSRIVLNTLGVEDFGIFNVVGGIVMMFSFLNASMSTATQRFLSFEIGKKNLIQLKKTFSMSINIHIIIAIVIFIFAETVGLWFLNNKLVIPIYRLEAANWVYQFSILSLIVNVIRVPFNSLIIAHERMKMFAYVCIFEAILKLIIVLLLIRLEFDKLKLYSILIFIVTLIICFTYWLYCHNNFKKTKYIFYWKNKLFKTLISYGGWNLFGGISGVAMQNGLNILLNLFFGPIVNAARGISFQVNAAVNGFVSNFQIAMYPQIVKSYAKDDIKYMHKIIFQGSKYSFYLLLFITLPILIETESVLTYWLGMVPKYTVLFCRLVLINSLIDCISGPLMTATQATGKIKVYQAIVGSLLLINLPISYLILQNGFPPETVLFVSIIISIIALFVRLYLVMRLIDLSFKGFVINVLLRILVVSSTSIIVPVIFKYIMNPNLMQFFVVILASFLSVLFFIYWLGLEIKEKVFVKNKFNLLLLKLK